MIRRFYRIGLALALAWPAVGAAGQQPASVATVDELTLDECQQLARQNYPLIKRYDLIGRTVAYDLSNLSKGWLPQVQLTAQTTMQSDVATLPETLRQVLSSNGYAPLGLKKDQYRVAVDVSQMVYDGGSVKAGREVARQEGEVQLRRNDVDLYALRRRVQDLFFGALLMERKMRINEDTQTLLRSNMEKIETLCRHGAAMQMDADGIRAEWLGARQQHADMEAVRDSYLQMLGIFIGRAVDKPLRMPLAEEPSEGEVSRPELLLYHAQTGQLQARRRQLDTALRPRLHLFAQGYYGYPGLDMFGDMFSHDWTLNGIVGLRLSWNIGSLYTRKNDRRKIETSLSEVDMARESFLFNTRLQTTGERAAIERYRKVMADDEKIIRLRASVRRAAEAKLANGIIDVNGLLQEITRENRACVEQSVHEIELLRSIYELKNTLNQ